MKTAEIETTAGRYNIYQYALSITTRDELRVTAASIIFCFEDLSGGNCPELMVQAVMAWALERLFKAQNR